jgi:hypothetical protein
VVEQLLRLVLRDLLLLLHGGFAQVLAVVVQVPRLRLGVGPAQVQVVLLGLLRPAQDLSARVLLAEGLRPVAVGVDAQLLVLGVQRGEGGGRVLDVAALAGAVADGQLRPPALRAVGW